MNEYISIKPKNLPDIFELTVYGDPIVINYEKETVIMPNSVSSEQQTLCGEYLKSEGFVHIRKKEE